MCRRWWIGPRHLAVLEIPQHSIPIDERPGSGLVQSVFQSPARRACKSPGQAGANDLFIVPLAGDKRQPSPFLQTPVNKVKLKTQRDNDVRLKATLPVAVKASRAVRAQIAIQRSRLMNPGRQPDLKRALGPVPAYERAVREVSRMLADAGIRHALVGALGANAYRNRPRTTADVEFLVGNEAFETHAGGFVTMQREGHVDRHGQRTPVLVPRQEITGADRQWAERYETGDVVRYSRGSKALGTEAGDYARVERVNARNNQVTVKTDPVASWCTSRPSARARSS